ncbi:unnamed protein product [Dovyalis caffra]|uniref:Uncharacterized protein n=1 Tax=Dovyalis caffra TaxID=77055 RepID=A0AAV1S097_9ROSI|nr:unnamed protein product [Dovyalis caffra]
MALVSDRSLEMGTVKIASTKHFSTEVKVEKGRRLRRSIPSPPPPKPNRLGRWRWVIPPTSVVQAYDTADQQAALETTSSRNWNFAHKLKSAYPLEKLRGNGKYTKEKLEGTRPGYHQIYQPSTGIKIILALDSSDRQSGTVKIASTKHFSADEMVKPDRRLGRPTPPSPNPNTFRHYDTPPANRNPRHRLSPPPPMAL